MTASIIGFSFTITMFAFFCTVILLRLLIPVLKSHKMGQKIYDIGPRWHKGKEGTPVMGGIAFILPTVFAVLLFAALSIGSKRFSREANGLCVMILALGNGLIGVLDDMTKLNKKQNLGLKAGRKLLLQILFDGLFVAVLALLGILKTRLYIPFLDKSFDLGIFYYIFLTLFIAAVTNAVNLTDGIDGLAASVTGIVALLFTLYTILGQEKDIGLSSVTSAVLGGCGGFLVYNAYPARIFMGDTGSLFLGGFVAGVCVMMNNPLIVLLCGIVFVAEELSVILQVGYYKLTHGKRLFKMAPIHHHFEKCGWSERKIVAVFAAVTAVFCVLAWFGL